MRSSLRSRLVLAFLSCGAALALGQSMSASAQKLFDQGKFEESRRLALTAINEDKGDIESYVVLCGDLLALGRWADAENYAQKALAQRADPRLLEILGEAAFNQGANTAALRHFQDYVSAVPEGTSVGRAYFYMGEIYLRLARYAHADIAFSTALQFIPGNARWWSRLGWAREKAKDISGALSAYAAALRIEPRLEDALLGKERVESSE